MVTKQEAPRGTRWANVCEASKYVGVNRFTLYRLISKGVLPVARVGRAIRVDLEVLDELLRRGGLDGRGK